MLQLSHDSTQSSNVSFKISSKLSNGGKPVQQSLEKIYEQAEKVCEITKKIVKNRKNYLKNVENCLSNSVSAYNFLL